MKKLIAIGAMIAATSAMADSVTTEYQRVNVLGTGADQSLFLLGYKHDFNTNLAGDISISNTITEGTNTVGARFEAGVTPAYKLGPVTAYTRVAVGEKTSSGAQFTYYSVEPGVTIPLTGALSAKVGYRWRSAVDTANGDQTHTQRVGLSYALSKVDTIGIRYDRMRGDFTQNSTAVNYTRSF